MNKKQIIISGLGNTLEWFDFGLFIFLAPIIGEKFFSLQNPTMATIAAFAVFAAGFICRPLGGILFGHVGDIHGRAKTLRVSIMIITLSTLLVAVLPVYNTIGILAPLLFILLRLAQGISIGGEYSGVMIYLAESAPVEKRGFITSFAATGANIGFLAATVVLMLLTTFFSKPVISAWAWRLPFIFIGMVGSVIFYYRFKLEETPTFSYLKHSQQIEKKPFFTALKYAPTKLLKILGLTCMSSTLYYVFFGYMPTYLENYIGIDSKIALGLQSFFLVVMLFLVPLAGFCGDRFGRKKIMIMTAMGVILLALPCFYLLQSHLIIFVFLSSAIATLLSSFDQGNSLTAVVENCPANVRYSGIAFSYNLGMALFGGTAPLLLTLLTQEMNLIAPAYYLMFMAGISLIAASTLVGKANILDFLRPRNFDGDPKYQPFILDQMQV